LSRFRIKRHILYHWINQFREGGEDQEALNEIPGSAEKNKAASSISGPMVLGF
jgi:transposase-like protein